MDRERRQRVDRIFASAMERPPGERADFLAQACAGDEKLRKEVETLIPHDQAGSFIEVPASEDAARFEIKGEAKPLAGQRVGAYEILKTLGAGGMGEVYLAKDTRLNRQVALKFLSSRFTTDESRVHRFKREALAASTLNHPNIITIHEIGTLEGADFIATEFVDGVTLRERMKGGRLELAKSLDIALQIAGALAAAHDAGIVHRDVKPENVMVRHDGYVKVLDFGLAKLIEPSPPADDSQAQTATGANTEIGAVVGTPRYMSPEQARGEKVDARTDIFSLGSVLYEMITGCAPFAGATTSDVIASILKDAPPPLADFAPKAPRELERIVRKTLRKDREERYQTIKELLNDLKDLKQELMVGDLGLRTAEAKGRDQHTEYSDPKPKVYPFVTRSLAVLAVLIIAGGAAAAWFYFNREPALTEKDTIVLADFENKTGDDIFDGTLKQGLAIQLQQSPFLRLFPEAQMRLTLQLMGRLPNDQVTAEIAREICVRHNLKALIAGAIAPLGSHYVITLEAINGQSGESLARQQVETESREQVLRALSQAAARLREKLGESLSSIQRFDKPLEQATTSNLEAFKAWSLGIEHSYSGSPMEAIPFYKRAVELDPEFANAYSVLSVVHWVTGRPGLAAEYAEKGYKLRDRVSEYEKFRIASFYHGFATGDLAKRIEVLMLLKQTYPREWTAPTDLALTYNALGQYDQAVAEAREAVRLNPTFAPSYWGLGSALLGLNRFAEAKDTHAQAFQQKLEGTNFRSVLYRIAFIQGDTAGMQQQLDWARGRPYEYIAVDWQTGSAAFAGQWRKAQELAGRAIDLAARGDTKEVAAQYATEQALRGAVFGDCRQAGIDAAQGLKLARGRVSLPRAALALALCGEAKQAKPLIDELTRRYPQATQINSIWLPAIRAAVELERGNSRGAIEQLRESRYEAAAEFWPQYLRGQANLKLGRGPEAAKEFQEILNHRGQAPLSVLYPLAYSGLARSAALAGDKVKRQKACEELLLTWKDADGDLPILIEAKRECEKK